MFARFVWNVLKNPAGTRWIYHGWIILIKRYIILWRKKKKNRSEERWIIGSDGMDTSHEICLDRICERNSRHAPWRWTMMSTSLWLYFPKISARHYFEPLRNKKKKKKKSQWIDCTVAIVKYRIKNRTERERSTKRNVVEKTRFFFLLFEKI